MNLLVETSWPSRIIRVGLGLVFVYSSWSKLADPPGFAQMIWNYRILPAYLVNPAALVLPWMELLAGLALVSGILHKGAALAAALMLALFIAALATDLARGIAVDCGCFSVVAQAKSATELFAGMQLDILRDAGLLLLAGQVLFSRMEMREPVELQGR